jgi:hypothetical protein
LVDLTMGPEVLRVHPKESSWDILVGQFLGIADGWGWKLHRGVEGPIYSTRYWVTTVGWEPRGPGMAEGPDALSLREAGR